MSNTSLPEIYHNYEHSGITRIPSDYDPSGITRIPSDPDLNFTTQVAIDTEASDQERNVVPKFRFYQFLFPLMNSSRSFVFDIPMILSSPMKSTLGMTDDQVQWLYSSFYIPAIVFNLLYGAWMKKFGAGFTYVGLLLMITGHIVFSMGLFTNEFWMMILGRVLVGAGGEGTLVSQTYVIKMYTHEGNVAPLISACKWCARVALLVCYYCQPQIYLATGGFVWPMVFALVVLLIGTGSFAMYLPMAKAEAKAKNHGKEPSKGKPFRMRDLKELPLKYYYLLLIRFGCLGAWFGFSAIFMQYLEVGCGLDYKTAALILCLNPLLSLTIVTVNMFVTKYVRSKHYLNYAMLVVAFLNTLFLWVSAYMPEKDMSVAIFAIVIMSIGGGYYNVCIDTLNTKALPANLVSIGGAISMSVKGIACIIFPLINGAIMGKSADANDIASCCKFLAIPCTLGFIFVFFFIWDIRKEDLRAENEKNTLSLKNKNLTETLIKTKKQYGIN